MAQKSNYALISALYASTNKGLYSDIYFPIIKYSIAKIFFSKGLENGYCTADAVNQFIKERFGINIPIIVIAKTVAKISVLSGSEDIVVYEKEIRLISNVQLLLKIRILIIKSNGFLKN